MVVLSVEAELSVFALLPQPVSEAANIAAINEYIYILFIIILLFSRSIGGSVCFYDCIIPEDYVRKMELKWKIASVMWNFTRDL